jgi:hypothetical protein
LHAGIRELVAHVALSAMPHHLGGEFPRVAPRAGAARKDAAAGGSSTRGDVSHIEIDATRRSATVSRDLEISDQKNPSGLSL